MSDGEATIKPAALALAYGTVFRGRSFGVEGETAGEMVFNTSMTGYQEILTDPSYRGQLVCMTYTEIGNAATTPKTSSRAGRLWRASSSRSTGRTRAIGARGNRSATISVATASSASRGSTRGRWFVTSARRVPRPG